MNTHIRVGLVVGLCVMLILGMEPVRSEMLSSSNYKILFNSIGCGSTNGSSTNYRVQGSVCDMASTDLSSASYVLTPGFRGLEDIPFLTVQFSDPDGANKPNTVEFGPLSTSSVKTDNIRVTITTNAEGGYASTIVADGSLRLTTDSGQTIAGASDNPTEISAGSGKYGFKTSNGSFDSTYTDITTSPKTFSTDSSPVSGKAVTLVFSASPSSATGAGDYTQRITVITTGTF
ncbi:hypothetical protein HY621_02870 [Candidatus Uhrbacteria bacterium]|nr:hypothetical protein [Candidatus Uhrbacteria bacterium]